MEPFNISEYMSRLGIGNYSETGLVLLKIIHKSHLFNIPFENLSIPLKQKIVLDNDQLFNKIIVGKRGGFCYELNGLFFHLITQLGIRAKMISAGVYNEENLPGPEFDHMAIIAELDGKEWLCDVGFGDSFIEPLEFIPDKEQLDSGKWYKVIKDDIWLKLISSDDKVNWKEKYRFTETPRVLKDFNEMCLYHQTSPESTFTRKKICTIATETGRITLSEKRLIITEGDFRKEFPVKSEKEFVKFLAFYFNISYK